MPKFLRQMLRAKSDPGRDLHGAKHRRPALLTPLQHNAVPGVSLRLCTSSLRKRKGAKSYEIFKKYI